MFLSFLLALVPLIIAHELGHMLMAKLNGVWVREFGIGFPPRIAKLFRWAETEFTLNWIPLGGFVRLEGEEMFAPEPELDETGQPIVPEKTVEELAEAEAARAHSLYAQPPWRRILIFLGGPLTNLFLAWALAIFIFAYGLPQANILLTEIAPGSPAAQAGLQPGDAIIAVDGTPVNGYPMDGGIEGLIAYIRERVGDPIAFTIERDGAQQTLNVTPRVNPPEGEGALGVALTLELTVLIHEVESDSPAEAAGLEAGDQILAMGEQPVRNGQDVIDYAAAHAGEELAITVLRDGETRTLPLTPRETATPEQGHLGIVMSLRTDTEARYPLGQALARGTRYLSFFVGNTLMLPINLLRGFITPQEARPAGPVGISQIAYATVQESIATSTLFPILNVLTLISISLALFNLLPIPALDGGRILFSVLEGVGRPVPPEKEERTHMIALFIMLLLFVVITIFDLLYPVIS